MRNSLLFVLSTILCLSASAQKMSEFTSVEPKSQTQELVIPSSHVYQYLVRARTTMTDGEQVGFNNDFAGYIPFQGSSLDGYLCINSEFLPGGVSVFDISYDINTHLWQKGTSGAVDFSDFSCITAGTAINCSGGITPWGTMVTCEENDISACLLGIQGGYNHYGWNIEIDPATKMPMDYDNDGTHDKAWAMGCMKHENVVFTADSTTAYYGDDNAATGYLYKFIMRKKTDLSDGDLYLLQLNGAQTAGTWIKLNNSSVADRNNTITQSNNLNGTKFNRIEDVEIGPDGKIYFSSTGLNIVYRFTDDGLATVSNFEKYVDNINYTVDYGTGTQSVLFSWPDNLAFDPEGNLWICQDGGNNHVWVARKDHSAANPKIEVFANTPDGSEPTGIFFTPDGNFMFLSIQHPTATNNVSQLDVDNSSNKWDESATIVIARKEWLGPEAVRPCPEFTFEFNTDNGVCGDTQGVIRGSAVGGILPYHYTWKNAWTSDTMVDGIGIDSLADIDSGLFYLIATDSTGCIDSSESIYLGCAAVSCAGFNVSVTKQNANCPTADGFAEALVVGGQQPFSYFWTNGTTTAVNDMLDAGVYVVVVTDARGCVDSQGVIINCIQPGCENFSVDATKVNGTCGDANGSATLIVNNGWWPYNIQWSNGVTTAINDYIDEGWYTAVVTDSIGCVDTVGVFVSCIDECPQNSISYTIQNPRCGKSDGLVTAVPDTGTPPFTYVWSNGQTGDILVNVPAGIYSVTVTDADSCETVSSVVVNCDTFICPTITISDTTYQQDCPGGVKPVFLSATGGVPPYTYYVDDTLSGDSVYDLVAGFHTVVVVDADSCTATKSIFVDCPTAISDENGEFPAVDEYIYLFPNPVRGGKTRLHLTHPVFKPYNVRLFDMTGKLLLREFYMEERRVYIRQEDLPNGTYILNVEREDDKKSFKLIFE